MIADSPVRPTPVETVTPLRPSELLRLGSLDTYQVFGHISDMQGGFCALGTLEYGAGNLARSGGLRRVGADAVRLPPILWNFQTPCPELSWSCSWQDRPSDLIGAVVHLNDEHRWTRGGIADWLESIGQ